MKRDWICIIGAIVGFLTGIGRGIGGLTLLSGAVTEIIIGSGLIVVAVWLVLSAIALMLRQDVSRKKWLTAGIVIFWLDGIMNGFVLFGSPQLSGQIVNMAIVLTVVCCLWLRRPSVR